MTNLVPLSTNDIFDLAERICKSPMVPQTYRGKPVDTALAMMYGQEVGIPSMASLQRIQVINGKPGLDGQGMVALIRSNGHSVTADVSNTEAKVYGKRGDNGDEMAVSFTIEDAKKAGLVKNGPWIQFPSDMLWAKAVSRLARRLFADVLMGLSYTPDEIEEFSPGPDTTITGLTTPIEIPEIEPVSTIREPPAALQPQIVEEETGEIIEDPRIALKATLTDIINTAPDNLALKGYLIATYGPAKDLTVDQLQGAITVASGWPETRPFEEPEDAEF